MSEANKKHEKRFSYLIGKKIKKVEYMSRKTANQIGWHYRPLTILFDDESVLYPQRDDEGNDGGALYYIDKNKQETIYVIT